MKTDKTSKRASCTASDRRSHRASMCFPPFYLELVNPFKKQTDIVQVGMHHASFPSSRESECCHQQLKLQLLVCLWHLGGDNRYRVLIPWRCMASGSSAEII